MSDVTNRVIVIFTHPKHTEEKPMYIGIQLLNLLKYGPPVTKKGKPYTFLETHLIQ